MQKDKKSLSYLTSALINIENEIVSQDGVISPEVEQELDLSHGDFKCKIDNYAACFLALSTLETYLKEQKADIDVLLKRVQASRNNLNYNLDLTMARLGKTELRGSVYSFYEDYGRGSVEVSDIDKVPFEYKRIKTDWEPDKVAIRKAIDAGIYIEGAYIQKDKSIKSKVIKV